MHTQLQFPRLNSRFGPLLALVLATLPLASKAQESVDTSFAPLVTYETEASGIQADGKIISGHAYRTNSPISTLFRLLPSGSVDTSFSHFVGFLPSEVGPISEIRSVSSFMDGTTAVSGAFDSVDGIAPLPRIAKFSAAGDFVAYFAPLTTSPSFAVRPYISALPDNRALIYGRFGFADGATRNGIALLQTNGVTDFSFLPNPGTTSTGSTAEIDHAVFCALMQPDGKVILAGMFDRMNGLNYPYLVRVTSKGVLDASFNPQPSDLCHAVVLLPDGKLFVSGQFSSIGGGNQPNLAKLNSDGTLDSSFVCSLDGDVYSMVLRADGKLMIGGSFTTVNGEARQGLALLESNGSLSPAYASLGVNGSVEGVTIQADGKIIINGGFTSIGGVNQANMARLNPEIPAVSELSIDPNGTSATWIRGGSAPELENAEFRMGNDGVTFGTLLGKGIRSGTNWTISNLKLPGNKTFHIQVRGLERGAVNNASTSVISSADDFFRPLPVITTQPIGATVVEGQVGVSFTVAATSAATISYQWRRNGAAIAGATAATYTFPAGVLASQAGSYTCTITSTVGSVTSAAAVLVVVVPITITKPPVFQAVLAGKPATFSVTVTGSTPTYVWKLGGNTVPGATGATYRIPAAGLVHEGEYTVEVTNFAGTVVSSVANLYIVDASADVLSVSMPTIVAMGAPVNLTATIASESPPVLQWLRGTAPIKGATSANLNLASATLKDGAAYSIKASNPAGGETSSAIEVAVVDQTSVKHHVLKVGKPLKMTALAAGNGLTYKWKKGAADVVENAPFVTGTTTKTLAFTALAEADSGDYTCEVTAPGGMLPSAVQKVSVTNAVPDILDGSLDFPEGMVGADYDYTVPVDATTAMAPNKFAFTGLPAGLKFDAFTGRITGRPTTAKTYGVTVTASNDNGKSLPATDSIIINPIPTGLTGAFVAVLPAESATVAFPEGGRLDVTVTTAGTYSGKLTLGQTALPFTGGKLRAGVGFNNTNTIIVPRRGTVGVTLSFDIDPATLLLTGTATQGADSTTLSGWKNKWSATTKATLYKGYYTMSMQPPVPGVGDFTYPHGNSYASFTVAEATGALTVAGRLADDTVFTAGAAFVGPTGQVAVYAAPYKPSVGAVWGTVSITSAGAAPDYFSSTIAGTLHWQKLPQATGVNYAAGFGPLALTAVGARYVVPTVVGQNVMGSNPSLSDIAVSLAGANVPAPPTLPSVMGSMTTKNVFTLPTVALGNTTSTTLKLDVAKGLLTGSFVLDGRTAKIYGIVVRDVPGSAGTGWGYFNLVQYPVTPASLLLSGSLHADVP